VTAVLRYELALLARSHRWLPSALLYVAGVVAGSFGGMPLASGLGWSGAMLVPAVGWLTRSALTTEPPAARACAATMAGPRRAQGAALAAAVIIGVILGVAGGGYELLITQRPTDPGVVGGLLVAGIVACGTCLLIGSAIGALCNPPVIRHPAYAVMSTAIIAITAITAPFSPANTAIRAAGAVRGGTSHVPLLPAGTALVLAAVTWAISMTAAARRPAEEF
jgi:hypothetical protein